jgi:hypothetical protein
MRCSYCSTPGKLYRQTNGNGAFVVVERCPKCKGNTRPGFPFLSKKDHLDWETLPLFDDLTKHSEPCAVKGCGRKDTESHHFAPKHLFEDFNDWPTAWLCQEHHRQWHKLTKTGMYAPRREKVPA